MLKTLKFSNERHNRVNTKLYARWSPSPRSSTRCASSATAPSTSSTASRRGPWTESSWWEMIFDLFDLFSWSLISLDSNRVELVRDLYRQVHQLSFNGASNNTLINAKMLTSRGEYKALQTLYAKKLRWIKSRSLAWESAELAYLSRLRVPRQ